MPFPGAILIREQLTIGYYNTNHFGEYPEHVPV